MCFYQFGRHWLCNTAKPPHLEAKNHQVMGGQLPDSQKAAPFFPMSFPRRPGRSYYTGRPGEKQLAQDLQNKLPQLFMTWPYNKTTQTLHE